MAQAYTVTASTSVVLINTIQAPNTIVLLSSIQNAGHIVGVRDTTGSAQIAQYPVIVSTMSGLQFYDGTSSVLLNQPNGSLSLSSKDRFTWQLLNNKGFLNTLSNSFVDTLNVQSAYIWQTSTGQEYVSSITSDRVSIRSSIQVNGQVNIQGSLTLGGSLTIFSSLTAYENLYLSSSLYLGGPLSISTFADIQGPLVVGSNLSTLQSLYVKDALIIDKNLQVQRALLPQFVSVQTLQVDRLQVGGGLQAFGSISTSAMSVSQDVFALGKGVFESLVNVSGLTSVADQLTLDGFLKTGSLEVKGSVSAYNTSYLEHLTAAGSVSTLSTLLVNKRLTMEGDTLVLQDINVRSNAIIQDLFVKGTTYISSLAVYSVLESIGDSSSYSSTFLVTKELDIQGDLAIGEDVKAGKAFLSAEAGFSTLTNLSVYDSLIVQGTLNVRQDSKVLGSLEGLSTLYVASNVSTTSLSARGEMFVDGSLYVTGLASASTLGAPIFLSISTLGLSNAMIVGSYGSIPYLQMNGYPENIAVGPNPILENYDIAVDGILGNRSTIQQTNFIDASKLWTAQNIMTSTLSGSNNLSSIVFGPTNTLTFPLAQSRGVIITGQNTLGGSNIYYASNASTTFFTSGAKFGVTGFKVAFNGTDTWVAVGQGFSAAESIKASVNGYDWLNATAGGFAGGAKDIAYGNGVWVAVGNPTPAPDTTIQYSLNGRAWNNVTGSTFPLGPIGGSGVAYNGTNRWVAVGDHPGQFGIKYSNDGINWAQATTPVPPVPALAFVSVAYGNGVWLATSGSTVWSSQTGITWSQISGIPGLRSPKYTGSFWIAGTNATGGNPMTSIVLSFDNGVSWAPIQTGGFTIACYDIVVDLQQGMYIAVGTNSPAADTIIQYSIDGQNWFQSFAFPGTGYGVGVGQIEVPLIKPFFTPNLTTIFRSTLSSVSLFTSSVKASSINGTYFADGTNLSKVGTYTSSILTSSIKATSVFTYDISATQVRVKEARISDNLVVPRTNFFSSGNIFLGAGSDSQSLGSIQISPSGLNWVSATSPSFAYYGNSITGNGDRRSPLYVAAGADTQTKNTLQWSVDGRLWNPATTGGFSYATSSGVREGTGVAYTSTLGIWAAVGKDLGGTNTIYSSGDGSNWSVATGGFTDYGTKVKGSPLGFLASGNGHIKYSVNGTSWFNSLNVTNLTAFDYGVFTLGPGFTYSNWFGVNDTALYYTLNGISWAASGGNTLASVTDIHYANGQWVAVGGNNIQYSLTGFDWSYATTSFTPDVQFYSVTYNSNNSLWIAGAKANSKTQTLWRSTDGDNWVQATSGGFSTAVLGYGVGFGVTTLGASTFAVGKSALDNTTSVKSAILQIFSTPTYDQITSVSLTNSNTSNVFSTLVRGIYATASEVFNYVAVGDGQTPQKTIARSLNGNPGTWIPAITGGFSTTGYGVTYSLDKWIAVGDAQFSTNTIQYSPDGANWFGTNDAFGLREGGRGVSIGFSTLYSTIVAVGKDTTTSTLLYSLDSFHWSNTTGVSFNVQGNGVGAGTNFPTLPFPVSPLSPQFIAVGQDTRGPTYSILRSLDGISWSQINSGGFDIAAYGAAYNTKNSTWVVVGQDTDPSNSIQYSFTGGYSFVSANNPFTYAGYGVTYNSSMDMFYAVGQDQAGDSPYTIKYSGTGVAWSNVSTNSGFISQKSLGAAYSVYTQGILTTETIPYLDFPNFIVYERPTPLLYPKPTIRLQSTYMTFAESLFVNLSSQVIIGSNIPILSSVLSVYGNVCASSITFTGKPILPTHFMVSSMIVSTLSSVKDIQAFSLTTPAIAINAPLESRANTISTLNLPTTTLDINNTLFIPYTNSPQSVGIGTQTPQYSVDVKGIFAASTLSTSVLYAPSNVFVEASKVYFKDTNLQIFEGEDSSLVLQGNRWQTNASSFTMNSILTLQVSTQRVGIYTRDPQFDLDVQRNAYLSTLRTTTLNTSLLFLTLQSV